MSEQGQTKPTSVWLPVAFRRKLKALAALSGASESAIIRALLDRAHFSDFEPKPGGMNG